MTKPLCPLNSFQMLQERSAPSPLSPALAFNAQRPASPPNTLLLFIDGAAQNILDQSLQLKDQCSTVAVRAGRASSCWPQLPRARPGVLGSRRTKSGEGAWPCGTAEAAVQEQDANHSCSKAREKADSREASSRDFSGQSGWPLWLCRGPWRPRPLGHPGPVGAVPARDQARQGRAGRATQQPQALRQGQPTTPGGEQSRRVSNLVWKKRNHFKALVHHPRANSRSSQEKQRGSFFPLHQLPWPLGSALLPEAPGGWPALEGDAEAQKGCSCTGNSGDACRARRRRAGTENLPSEEGQSRNRTESEHSLAAPRHTLCAGHADGLPVDPAGPGEQFQAPVPEHFCAETRRWALGNLLGRDLDFTPGRGRLAQGPISFHLQIINPSVLSARAAAGQ